jgi:hypothetical protein
MRNNSSHGHISEIEKLTQNTWIEYIPSEIVTGSMKACWDRGASKAGTTSDHLHFATA